MTLPADFHFTQSSLQDYMECPRRFELRYLQHLKWPAVETEPVAERERHLRQGAAFHRLVHRHLIGIPAEILAQSASEKPLLDWWNSYLQHGITDLPALFWPELTLAAPLAGYRLLARYDLVAVQPGERAVIVDWKTTLRRPARVQLQTRLQTAVYRYLLVAAGAHLNNGQSFQPEQVAMVYWFTDDPQNPERFPYDKEAYAQDEQQLTALAEEIKARSVFDLTADERRCAFCVYRSLCRRGVSAGSLAAVEDDRPGEGEGEIFDFDFDQIVEIEF